MHSNKHYPIRIGLSATRAQNNYFVNKREICVKFSIA